MATYTAISNATTRIQDEILEEAMALLSLGVKRYKRKCDDGELMAVAKKNKRQKVFAVDSPSAMPDAFAIPDSGAGQQSDNKINNIITSPFMRSPTEETIKTSLCGFLDQTGNAAACTSICAVCARECDQISSPTRKLVACDVPHPLRLSPHSPHPAHILHEEMLLYPESINSNSNQITICEECLRSLQADTTPKHALANNLWIGEVPKALKDLTLPERILIAKYYPAAYIIKLFPKKRGSWAWDQNQMHRGLKGNVSTYRLDPAQVSSMIEGHLMPPPARILSATIGITFVGPRGLPESTMPAMFRVRRYRVHKALAWLKENNPLYADILISDAHLMELPKDGVPKELTLTAKHSTDSDAAYREQDGYVPLDLEDEVGKASGVYSSSYYFFR